MADDATCGKVMPFERYDQVLGQTVGVSVSERYTTLRMGRRHYYFRQEDGVFDGTGFDLRTPCEQRADARVL